MEKLIPTAVLVAGLELSKIILIKKDVTCYKDVILRSGRIRPKTHNLIATQFDGRTAENRRMNGQAAGAVDPIKGAQRIFETKA